MSQNPSAKIRTVALVGHGAAGKTTLAESLLAATGAITTRGSVEKGNTVCDFDPVEKDLGHSLQSALVSLDWAGTQIHLSSTPPATPTSPARPSGRWPPWTPRWW
jgi:elongation factor G